MWTGEPAGSLRAEDTVRVNTNPSQVERVIPGLMGIDPGVRPIYPYKGETARGRIVLCVSAYSVERRLREASAPFRLDDEDSVEGRRRPYPPVPGSGFGEGTAQEGVAQR